MNISVVGLGKLGACSAACFAAKGHDVLGVDLNPDFVRAINEGRPPVAEPRLEEMIALGRPRLRATGDFAEAVRGTDVTFLIVPTPSLPSGEFSNAYLESALGSLASALRSDPKPYHLFVITSTTSPGACSEVLIPLIERMSGRRLNEGFGLCYNPEFIALGSVVSDFLRPDMLLIGESSARAGDILVEVYAPVCENKPQVSRMSLVSAEIAKISLNAYVTMKISFANGLMNVCEAIPEADIDAITRALGADRRVSPHYLRGGLAFGGPCFPRDNRAFSAFAARSGCEAHLAKATDAVNQDQTHRLVARIGSLLADGSRPPVAVLGLAYKPNTPVIEESAGIALVRALLQREHEVIVYDPLALPPARSLFGHTVRYAGSVQECFETASICVITTPADEFKRIDAGHIRRDPTTVVDCWRILDPLRLGPKAVRITLDRQDGRGAALESR